ncbi:MAG: endonuclease/exonuclease/phosphatase family protein [Rhizobiaceae bacterium]
MSLRIATFNVENLMNRFDYSGYRNQLRQDRTLSLYEIKDENEFRQLERARTIAHTDDARQLTALAIAETHADIICLQEVDNLEALNAFEYGYLFKMVGQGYRRKYHTSGNDSRGIDVAVMMRDETRHGQEIEFVRMTSHAHVTYEEFDLHNKALGDTGNDPHERVFRRDCLEIDLKIGGRPLTLYVVHFKSMGSPRDGVSGREFTMPIRFAEAKAVRRIIENRFGKDKTASKRWIICGDMNDYQERVVVDGDALAGFSFAPAREDVSALDVFSEDGFAINPVERLPELERWTLYHTRGPEERHLCQLDYIWLSPSLADLNAKAMPEIIRGGQPWRTLVPPGQQVDRYPRTGWDRPKASDHCPVAITLDMV